MLSLSLPLLRSPLSRSLRTQFSSSLQAESYAAHGVLETIVPTILPDESQLSVGVVASSWPSWAIPFSHARFNLKWILIFDTSLISTIRKCFPDTTVYSSDTVDVITFPSVDIVAYNGPLPQLRTPPSFGSLILLDWNARIKLDGNWDSTVYSMVHSQVGGVSDLQGVLKLCLHKTSSTSFHLESDLLETYPLSRLSSVLSHTENGTELSVPPRLPRLALPIVSRVTHRSFHPDGLYPASILRPTFLIPSVFVPSRWVKRALTTKELLAVRDIPASFIAVLSHREKLAILRHSVLPIKCLTALVSALFIKGKVYVSGGGTSGTSRINHGYNEIPVNDSGSLNSIANTIDAVSPQDLSNLPGAWIPNVKHNKDEKAVKHDKADVPIHFWNNSLAIKLNLKELTCQQQRAMAIIRSKFGQRVWIHNLTRCFCQYIRCKSCHIDRLQHRFDHKSSKVSFSCSRCKQHNASPAKYEAVVWENGKYKWKDEGMARYRRWFRVYRKKAILKEAKEIELDIEAGTDCISRAVACTPWSWPSGSRLFFWRWGEFREVARDGARSFVKGDLPNYSKRQRAPKKSNSLRLVQEKLMDVRNKGYISKGEVISVTSMFDVPKGNDDIRLVYDATKSGLNEAVWAPWFSLQTCESHLRSVDPGTYMGDADLGEMFLNFPLDRFIRMYAGVDLTELFPDEGKPGETFWERWERMLMGFRPSPYCTTREMRRIDLFLRGARNNPNNVFRWDRVILNLPGKPDYTSTRPKVFKVRKDGTMAADLFSYIDDLRNTAPSSSECWDGLHQVCCRLTWLGLQDAPRKRNGPTQTPRAWAGSIIHSDNQAVTVLVSEEKWDKTKAWIKWVLEHVDDDKGLEYKQLLSCRGFLIYVSRTYRPFKPYLRGLHKTIDSWRPFRDKDGWKVMQAVIEAKLSGDIDLKINQAGPSSKFIKVLPRLKSDFETLEKLTQPEAPPKVVRRRKKMASASYGFGDASGSGFGNAIEVEGKVHSEFGEWSAEVEDKHSNYKELRNLVNAVKKAYSRGLLKDCELFLFTDNFVAECGYYNGGSNRNKELDDLVHELWRLQMSGDFTLNVYHVAGTRMISCGVDGLSRGDKSEGIARGISVLKFIPIHLTAAERSPRVLDWIKGWWDESLGPLHHMSNEDWFDRIMEPGNFLWMVPPGAGEAAVEQLCAHTHGRPESQHLFVIPRLCTCHWRKQLLKACDVVLTIQPKFEFWPTNMHEPLLSLWKDSGQRCMECRLPVNKWTGIYCGNFYYARGPFAACRMAWHGNCYRLRAGDKFPIAKLQDIEGINDPSEDDKFKFARNGDNFLCPFQCDLCHFRNIQSRDPEPGRRQDANLLIGIRRANIDAFWGRSASTVKTNRSNLRRFQAIASDDFGMNSVLPDMGPHELKDVWGMGIAVTLLGKSLDKGLYGPTVQFETARKLRSAYSNVWGSSRHALTLGVLARDTMKIFVTQCPGYCLWFERFIRGMHSRMGDDRRPDAAISSVAMHEVMNRVEADFIDADSLKEARYFARAGLFFLSAFLGSLRGEEVPRTLRKEFIELNHESLEARISHCVLPLYGNFKNDNGMARCYLFRITKNSKTGFNMERWVRRVIEMEGSSRTTFLFASPNGRKESGQVYEPYFFAKLKSVQSEVRGILPRKLDVDEAFGISRSFRRGSVTAAGNAPNSECNEFDIKRNNRWRSEDRAGTKNAGLDMLQLYTDTLHSVEADLKFSSCL